MNTYSKYKCAPNVYLAKCPEKHEKGEIIPVTTKRGKDNDSIVFNFIYENDGFFYYSIVRADGYNCQERAKNRADKFNTWAISADTKSNDYYKRSNIHADFLSLGEPIKIGHHSEGRHRRIIEQRNNNMRKCVEFSKIATAHESKAEYWESRANDINLSIPESVDYFAYKLEKAKEFHQGLKDGKYKKEHSFSLTYAKRDVNELEKKYQLAVKLWK